MRAERQEQANERLRHVGKPCPYCRSIMRYDVSGRHPTRDHILPRARLRWLPGAMHHAENIVMACHDCNNDKGSMFLIEWWAALMHAGDERVKPVAAFIQRLLWNMPAEAMVLIGLGRDDDYAQAMPLYGGPSSGSTEAREEAPLSPPCETQRPTFCGLPQQPDGA